MLYPYHQRRAGRTRRSCFLFHYDSTPCRIFDTSIHRLEPPKTHCLSYHVFVTCRRVEYNNKANARNATISELDTFYHASLCKLVDRSIRCHGQTGSLNSNQPVSMPIYKIVLNYRQYLNFCEYKPMHDVGLLAIIH